MGFQCLFCYCDWLRTNHLIWTSRYMLMFMGQIRELQVSGEEKK